MKRKNISLSIVVPVYNESTRVGKTLSALQTWTPPKGVSLHEIIFVDDGSTDSTVKKITQAKQYIEKQLQTTVTIISYIPNQGKGYAVKTGMLSSKADYTLFMDADLSTPLEELTKFVDGMNKGIDVIVGTRKNGKSTVVVHQPKYREIFGKGFTYLSNIILNTWVTDFTCGFKVFSKSSKDKIFTSLTSNSWSFDAESIFLARQMGFTIAEIPVIWSDRKGSKVRLMKDALNSFIDLFAIRLYHGIRLNPSRGAKYRLSTR